MAGIPTELCAGGITVPVPVVLPAAKSTWTYEEAFKRNRGLITEEEQQKLRNSRVAIAGMGGVGGVHLITLARLGIGKFTIADPDVFEVANFNRQYGATISNLGRNKAEAMAEAALDINPELDIRVMREEVNVTNVQTFLEGADLFVDSFDAFHVSIRRVVFRQAAANGIYSIGAGPVGFSTVWVTFAPNGMQFDDYFAFSDGQGEREQFIRYIVGMAPKALHRAYVDASHVSVTKRQGPSSGTACSLATGVLSTECVKLLLKRGRTWSAPYYQQFDPFTGQFKRGRLRRGNRGYLQRMKYWYIRNYVLANA